MDYDEEEVEEKSFKLNEEDDGDLFGEDIDDPLEGEDIGDGGAEADGMLDNEY